MYGDAFLGASTTGARLINMGDAVADGHFDFVAHQQQQPYVTATGNIVPPPDQPGTWTAAWIAVHTNSTSCDGAAIARLHTSNISGANFANSSR